METTTSDKGINAIKDVRKLFNEHESNFSREETKIIRKKLNKKETVYNFLKEKKRESSLTNKEKNVLNNIDRYLKKFMKDLEKLQKYKYNITYGLKYLFNEEDYYEPIEIKSAFDDGYMLYESRGDKDAKLSIDKYLDIIEPYLKDMMDNPKARGEWKIQLNMRIIFVFFIDANETRVMHTKSDNIEIMSGTETNNAINELLKSFYKRYQEGLETKMKGSSFIFNSVNLSQYHLHKISLNRGRSYIDSTDWIKNRKATINPKNKDKECFKYAITEDLNHEKIRNNPQQNIKT